MKLLPGLSIAGGCLRSLSPWGHSVVTARQTPDIHKTWSLSADSLLFFPRKWQNPSPSTFERLAGSRFVFEEIQDSRCEAVNH